jgi:hypothetical protein
MPASLTILTRCDYGPSFERSYIVQTDTLDRFTNPLPHKFLKLIYEQRFEAGAAIGAAQVLRKKNKRSKDANED